jgi:hypothetical protein
MLTKLEVALVTIAHQERCLVEIIKQRLIDLQIVIAIILIIQLALLRGENSLTRI